MASIRCHRIAHDGNIEGGERNEWPELTRDISASVEGAIEEKQERVREIKDKSET